MISGLLAFARLMWRPGSLGTLFALAFAAFLPIAFLAEGVDSGLEVGSFEVTPAILWAESIALMGMAGVMFNVAALSGYQRLFAHTIPSLRSRVLRGKLIAGVMLALALAAALANAGDVRHAPQLFASGLLFFSVASAVADPVTHGYARFAGAGLIIVSALQTGRVRTLFEASPTVAIVAVLIVAVLHWREWSVESARKRVLFQATPVGYALGGKFTRAYALGIEIETATWKSRPATWLLRDWIRAAVYEVSGARKHGWLIAASTPVVFNCAIAYGFGLSEFAATFGLMQLSLMEARLLGDWAYPITRKDRATLAFVCSLLQNAAYFFPAMALWWWLDQTELPRLPFAEEPRSVPWGLAMFPIAFIWGPVVQWVRATSTSPLRDRLKTTGWTIRSFVHVIGGVVLTVTTAHAITDWLRPQSTTLAIVAMIVLAATVHLGYWLALRWHFSRRDLV